MNQNERHTLNGGEYVCPDGCGLCKHGEVSCLCFEDHPDETIPVAYPRYATEAEIDRALDALKG